MLLHIYSSILGPNSRLLKYQNSDMADGVIYWFPEDITNSSKNLFHKKSKMNWNWNEIITVH
jgi:hypothetical protein